MLRRPFFGQAQTEIEQAQAFFAQHDVAWLHVAMQHATAVGVRQGIQQRHGDSLQFGPRQPERPLAKQFVQGQAAHQLHGDEGPSLGCIHFEGVGAQNIRVVQSPRQGELAVEQRTRIG
ncbi:hypothetical protein D3C76_1161500 [compost metagenome]